MLFRYAVARVKNTATAEDLVQDTLIAGMKSIERFTGASSVRTWLVSILKHKIIDYQRKAKRTVLTDDETLPDWSEGDFADKRGRWKRRSPDWISNPGQVFSRAEFWEVLEGCMSGLKPRQREVFERRELEGQDSQEICDELGISASNLYILLYRARLSLRACLEKRWLEPQESMEGLGDL